MTLDEKDPHYTPLDVGKVEPQGPYAALDLECSGSKAEFTEFTNNSTREYAVPPDAISKPAGVTTPLESVDNPANTGIMAVPVAQTSSKKSKTGKKKVLLPKVSSGGKKQAPLALSNPTASNKKEDPLTQSTSTNSKSTGMSSVQPPATVESSTAATKRESPKKAKQSLSLPVPSQDTSAAESADSIKATPKKLSVAEHVKNLEKRTIEPAH